MDIARLLTGACAATLLAFSTETLEAQSLEDGKKLLNVWLDAQKDYNDWPSVSAAYVKGQEVVYSGAFGYANRENKVPATSDTLYSICSISKLFTSIAVMQLRDEGKLALRDPISKHLPDYHIKQRFPLSDDVSVEGILTHSSGLPREIDVPYWSPSAGFPFPSHEKAKEIINGQETLYRAWEHHQYSNLGLSLAGEIVATISGEDYHAYVQDRILTPLGLDHTYSEMPKDKHGTELAVGYSAPRRQSERTVMPYFSANAVAPAAGFASNAKDLAAFMMWQLKLRDGDGDEVLDHNTLREMQRPHGVIRGWKAAFGLGFSMKAQNNGGTLIGHGGYCPGYQSQIYIDPAKKSGGVALINAAGVDPAHVVAQMAAILEPLLGKSDATEEEEQNDAGAPEDNPLAEYQGYYDNQPWSDESYVMPWGDNLMAVWLTARYPMNSLTKLKHLEGDTFARLRDDGSKAETVTFLRGEDGNVNGLKWHSTISPLARR